MVKAFTRWLDSFDPYGIQRILFYKCLYIAVLLMIANVIFKPTPLAAYFWPSMMFILIYESPTIIKIRDKQFYLLLMYAICVFITISFYLSYPYKIIFTINAVLLYFIYFHFSSRYWQPVANSIFILFFIANSVVIGTPADMSLQMAVNIFFAMVLSMVVVYFGFRTFPNYTLYIWYRIFIRFMSSLIGESDGLLNRDNDQAYANYKMLVFQLNIIRSIRHSLKKKHMSCCDRIVVSLRDIHIAIEYASLTKTNHEFWGYFEKNLRGFLQSILNWQQFQLLEYHSKYEDFSYEHKRVYGYLNNAVRHWNRLCLIK